MQHCSEVKKKFIKIDSGYNFIVAGIVTPLPEYRLCWNLNTVLGVEFYKTDDITITIPENHIRQNFSRFVFEEDITISTFWVLQNKNNGDYLLPEVKQSDYLLLVKGTYYTNKLKALEHQIRKIPEVQTTITLQPNKLKNKERLIF